VQNLFAFDEDFKNPRSVQIGLGFERELTRDTIIAIDYSQVSTTRRQRNVDLNLPAPIPLDSSIDPARRPYMKKRARSKNALFFSSN
jgi:hypothetical protein